MASLSDILNTIQQGVVAVNNLVTQTKGSFLNIQSQITTISCSIVPSSGVLSFNGRVGIVTPAQGDYPTGLIPGTTTNGNATTGNIGEFVTAQVLSSVAVVVANSANANITSISVSAGDWDIWASLAVVPASSASLTAAAGGVSSISNSLPPSFAEGVTFFSATFSVGGGVIFPIAARRIALASSATYYLVAGISGSSGTGYGTINARRAR